MSRWVDRSMDEQMDKWIAKFKTNECIQLCSHSMSFEHAWTLKDNLSFCYFCHSTTISKTEALFGSLFKSTWTVQKYNLSRLWNCNLKHFFPSPCSLVFSCLLVYGGVSFCCSHMLWLPIALWIGRSVFMAGHVHA